MIGMPDADIQKVIIPQYGLPAKLKEVRIEFEQPYGAIRVSKNSADNGAMLSGATFELTNASGTVVATQTTGADGTARFDNLPAGVILCGKSARRRVTCRRRPDSRAVTVTAGGTATRRLRMNGFGGKSASPRRDSLTKERLAGAEFTVVLHGGRRRYGRRWSSLTTDANGYAGNGLAGFGQISRDGEQEFPRTTKPAAFQPKSTARKTERHTSSRRKTSRQRVISEW